MPDGPHPTQTSGRRSLDATAAAIWPSTQTLLAEEVVGTIAAQAAAADERGQMSTAAIDLLRDAGYFGLPVPIGFQGGGAGLLQCAAVQRRLGMADPALAIAVNMHLFAVGMATAHWHRRHDACGLLLEAVATQHRIVAAAFAEPGLGSTLLRSSAHATRVTGGYLVTGVKTPCSLAPYCDLVCFQMQADTSEPDALMTALIPSGTPGVRIERTWDALGMRASGSETLRLEECFVPNELVFHRCEPGIDDDEIVAAGLVWFCVTTTATYLGVVKTVFDIACAELRRVDLSHSGLPRAASPAVQHEVGDLVATTLSVEAACAALADRLDSGRNDPRALVPLALAIKHVAVDACVRAVDRSAELVGGRSYARKSMLARLWRDVQAVRFHAPTRLATGQFLGKQALDLPASFDFDGQPRGADVTGRQLT